MKTIFIVEGSTGEYSDHNEWFVRAFVSEAKAQALVAAASARAREIKIWADANDESTYLTEADEAKNQFDPNMEMQYTGTYYSCYKVELDEEI